MTVKTGKTGKTGKKAGGRSMIDKRHSAATSELSFRPSRHSDIPALTKQASTIK